MSDTRVNLTDGQGIIAQDLIDLQTFQRAGLEFLFSRFLSRDPADVVVDSTRCYAAGVAGMPLTGAFGNNTIQFSAGTIVQKLTNGAAPNGTTEDLLSYYIAPADSNFTTTFAVGHATLQRIDGVFVKLSRSPGGSVLRDFKDATTGLITATSTNMQSTVVATKSYVQGTPAATALVPLTPVGYVPLSYIVVPATFNAAVDPSMLRDVRVPVGGTWDFDPYFNVITAAGGWNRDTGGGLNCTGAAGTITYAPITDGTRYQRVLGFLLTGPASNHASLRVDLVRMDFNSSTNTETFTSIYSWFANSIVNTYQDLYYISGNPDGSMAGPLWGNGNRNPNNAVVSGTTIQSRLMLKFTSGNTGAAGNIDSFNRVSVRLAGS